MKIRIDPDADAQIINDFERVRFGFEIRRSKSRGDPRQLLKLLDGGKRTVQMHEQPAGSDDESTIYIYGGVELSTLERWCWKAAPKLMASRERDKFLDYFTQVGVTARKLSAEELRPGGTS